MGDGNYLGPIGDDAIAENERRGSHCYRVTDLVAIGPRGEILELDMFICGRLGPTCVQCGDVSEVLCDFPLGDEGRTCDKPLCTRCAPTIGADKNYCAEHANGHGLLLFPPPGSERRPVRQEELKEAVTRKPRLPKAPPPERRWRVVSPDAESTKIVDDEGTTWVQEGRPMTNWMHEHHAARLAFQLKGRIQTWDEFVAWHRKKYPLKKKPRKKT